MKACLCENLSAEFQSSRVKVHFDVTGQLSISTISHIKSCCVEIKIYLSVFTLLCLHYLWCCELLPRACSYPQLDTLQLLQRQLILHTRGDSIHLESERLLKMTTKQWKKKVWFNPKQVAVQQWRVSVSSQTSYPWIFHWGLSLFCMVLYPLFAVNSSRFEKLKTTVWCCSFSII